MTIAEQHYRAAADRVVPLAFAKLATLAEGANPPDVVEAYKWYTLFMPFAGDDESTYRSRMETLSARMRSEQIDEATRRADEWAAAHKPHRR